MLPLPQKQRRALALSRTGRVSKECLLSSSGPFHKGGGVTEAQRGRGWLESPSGLVAWGSFLDATCGK